MLNAENAQIVDKIQKLLALGTSSNEHEAAAAIAKAQSLMEQHDLVMADVENALKSDDSIVETGERVLVRRGKPEAWREAVARAVAETSDVWLSFRTVPIKGLYKGHPEWGEMVLRYEKAHFFIGMKRDVELAGYALDFLLGELERLGNEYTKARWAEIWAMADERNWTHQTAESYWVNYLGNKHPLSSRKYWLEGAAEGVSEALREDKRVRRQASDATNALVAMKSEAIRDWWYRKHYKMSYAEYQADRREREAKNASTAVAKPLTAAQRRRLEEQEARRRAREDARYSREWEREYLKRDHDAYRAGREAGRKVGVRPGVAGGTKPEKEIGS